MRKLAFALFLIAPAAVFAQTPGDIARQVWPAGAPASTAMPPAHPAAFGGFDRGISHELYLRDAPLTVGAAPATPAGAGAFSGIDLALLRTRGETSEPAGEAPVLAAIVATERK